MTDLGWGGSDQVQGINNNGVVAGSISDDNGGHFHTVAWKSGVGLQNLGQLPTFSGGDFANAINNRDQIVGISGDGFIWQAGTGMSDIGAFDPLAINNSGEVAGYGAIPGGTSYHARIWSPATGVQDLGTLYGSAFSRRKESTMPASLSGSPAITYRCSILLFGKPARGW